MRIYAVQAGSCTRADAFWAKLSADTNGRRWVGGVFGFEWWCFGVIDKRQHLKHTNHRHRLTVSQLGTVGDIIEAVVCRELGSRAFADLGKELRSRGRFTGETKYIYEEIRTTTVVADGKAVTSTTVKRAAGKMAFGSGGGGGGGGRIKIALSRRGAGATGFLLDEIAMRDRAASTAAAAAAAAAAAGAGTPPPPPHGVCRSFWAGKPCSYGRRCR